MRHYVKGICGLLLAFSVSAMADTDYSAVEERIRALAPSATEIAISETPIEGVLMVQVSGDIVYATADGKYLIQGRVIDLETREDLTEGAKSDIRKQFMAQMDTASQISFSPQDPDYELTVFTDIDCGYCRKLHAQVDEYNEAGIAIHYMAFPRAGIGSRSYEKAVSVWCADDPQEAMTQAKAGARPGAGAVRQSDRRAVPTRPGNGCQRDPGAADPGRTVDTGLRTARPTAPEAGPHERPGCRRVSGARRLNKARQARPIVG